MEAPFPAGLEPIEEKKKDVKAIILPQNETVD